MDDRNCAGGRQVDMTHGMKIIAVVAQKGGTGKSTLTSNLAVAAAATGLKTLVVDADPQASLLDWKRVRGGCDPAVLAGKSSAIHPMRFAAERSGIDRLFIDTRASALDHSLEAAKIADLTLIVVRPSPVDLHAIAATVEALRPLHRPAAFVLNQAPSPRLGREQAVVLTAVERLLTYGLPIAPFGLRERAVYQAAFGQGRSPLELEPLGAAARELSGLWAYVDERLRQPVVSSPIRFIPRSAPEIAPQALAG
jgi:chromosome partitioning protein